MRLDVADLILDRGGRRVLRGLSFSLAGGEVLVLEGRNGAGKTSLIRAVAGFIRPAGGDIRLDGGDPERSVGEQCHLVGHHNAIKPKLTVRENIAFWARFLGGAAGQADARRLDDVLESLDLTALAEIPVAYLSAGQRRRVALARLSVADRPVWLLDEPSVSLDAEAVGALAAAIGRHVAAGGLAIAATHVDLGLPQARRLRLEAGVAAP